MTATNRHKIESVRQVARWHAGFDAIDDATDAEIAEALDGLELVQSSGVGDPEITRAEWFGRMHGRGFVHFGVSRCR